MVGYHALHDSTTTTFQAGPLVRLHIPNPNPTPNQAGPLVRLHIPNPNPAPNQAGPLVLTMALLTMVYSPHVHA